MIAGLRTQCPLVSRLYLWCSRHYWLPVLKSSESMVRSGWGVPPGDHCQPSTGRLSLCSAPTSFRHFSVCQVLYSSNPDPGLHPRIMATSFQVHWLTSDICLSWAVPGPPHSHLLLEFQWSNGAKILWRPGHSPHLPYMFAFFSLRPERWNQNLVLTVWLATTLSLIPRIPLYHKGWAALLFLRLLYASFLL